MEQTATKRTTTPLTNASTADFAAYVGDLRAGLPYLTFVTSRSAFTETWAARTAAIYSDRYNLAFLAGLTLSSETAWTTAEEALAFVQGIHGKRSTLVGIDAGCCLALAMSLLQTRSVRRLALFNPETRLKPSPFERCIDRLEQNLPLGLPLRPLSKRFDARPWLHRIYCPTLIVEYGNRSAYSHAQTKLIAERIPNSWYYREAATCVTADILLLTSVEQMLDEFMQTPTKRPQ